MRPAVDGDIPGVGSQLPAISRVYGNEPHFAEAGRALSDEFSAVRCNFYGFAIISICNPSALSALGAVAGINIDI